MKTTIKQQIKAVQRSKKDLENATKLNRTARKDIAILNDTAITLAAVVLIGESRIKLIPQLIKELQYAQKSLIQLGDMHSVRRISDLLNNLNK